MKINVIFYSLYGHNHKMAEAVAEGAREVKGVDVGLYQVEETFTPEILEKMGATEYKKKFGHIPVATIETLTEADAIIFGTPTRFGMMVAQMRAFLDRTGGIWSKGELIGKVGSVFTSSSTQHGGQESTILSFHTTLLHHGMIVVGVPYSEERQKILTEITGGSPYGSSTITGRGHGSRQPSENELGIARFQGRHVAEITKRLVGE
ncbi:NAD(P)H:quinone oxidoreductase [uncultured Methanolobus sp.]|uniref:NAD(P)H:quinone oxidoreductase n=1 Tax=uncultured Methanolobus sp. TaxID=218300 RepID=UPI0029C6941A|nr:NAD(P)H:quinone oxidoreductase [uncultured Methanolobus sp.]